MQDATKKGCGSVVLSFKRYCIDGESKLPVSAGGEGHETKAEKSATPEDAPSKSEKGAGKASGKGGNSKKGTSSQRNKAGSKKGSVKKPKRNRTVETGPPACLIHAQLRNIKISTVVLAKDAPTFQSHVSSYLI